MSSIGRLGKRLHREQLEEQILREWPKVVADLEEIRRKHDLMVEQVKRDQDSLWEAMKGLGQRVLEIDYRDPLSLLFGWWRKRRDRAEAIRIRKATDELHRRQLAAMEARQRQQEAAAKEAAKAPEPAAAAAEASAGDGVVKTAS